MIEYLPIIVMFILAMFTFSFVLGVRMGEKVRQKQWDDSEKRARVFREQSDAYEALKKEITPYTIWKTIRAEIEYDKI